MNAGPDVTRLQEWLRLLAALGTGHDGGQCTRSFIELLRPWIDTTRFFPTDAVVLALDKARGCLAPAIFVQLHGASEGSVDDVQVEVLPEPKAESSTAAGGSPVKVAPHAVVREAQGYMLGELLLVAATEGYSQLAALLVDVGSK